MSPREDGAPAHEASWLEPPAPGRARVSADSSRAGQEAPLSAETFYAATLRRSQLRLSLTVAGAFLAVLTVLAVGASSWTLLEDVRWWGLPLSWWLIGVALYPLVLGAALLYQGAARRIERSYQQVSER